MFALIFQMVYGDWRLMSNQYPLGRITPEQYEKDYGTNRNDIQLRCPYSGENGKPCDTILEFTRSTERSCAFFSTKDNHEHAFGCFLRTNGKKRRPDNDELIRPELDFNSFFGSSFGEDDDENNDEDFESNLKPECDENSSESWKDDIDENPATMDYSPDASAVGSDEDYDVEWEGNDETERENSSKSQDKDTPYRANIEKLKGFVKIVALALGAAPNEATNNGYLVNDSTICKRDAEVFNEGIVELKKGDPMLIVARKWGKFSYDYSEEIGPNALFFRNLYIEKEYFHVFELRFDKLDKKERKKFFKVYGKDEQKNYDPQAFAMGVIYTGTRREIIGGRERLIDTFSLQNVKCFIEFTEELKKIDDANMRV